MDDIVLDDIVPITHTVAVTGEKDDAASLVQDLVIAGPGALLLSFSAVCLHGPSTTSSNGTAPYYHGSGQRFGTTRRGEPLTVAD